MNIRVSVIGAGAMAEEHIKAFRSLAGVQIAGIYSRTPVKAQQLADKYQIPIVCSSIEMLYDRTRAQLVVIAVSELSAKEVCICAFRYDWLCLAEKPAGYNLAEAIEIASEAANKKRQVFVALNRRLYGSTQTVLQDITALSKPRLIHVYDQQDIISAKKAGRTQQILDNWMFANSIHLIDYFTVLGRGEIAAVEHVTRWDASAPGFVIAKILFSSGDIGIYEAVWNGPGPWAVTVTTQEKRWELRPLEKATVQIYPSRQQESAPPNEWDLQLKPGFRQQAEEAIKAVKGEQCKLATIEEALESMKLVARIYA
jgi:predicted dehydrogenase